MTKNDILKIEIVLKEFGLTNLGIVVFNNRFLKKHYCSNYSYSKVHDTTGILILNNLKLSLRGCIDISLT